MEQIKRERSDSFNNYDDNKRKKIQVTTDETNWLLRKTISCFEDLSNELIYDIFEFLDYFHVYKAFFNLNLRFQNLLIHSNLPIQINLSSMSKSAFQCYNTDIIETNRHRISSLSFSDVFMYDLVLSSICKLLEFQRLETLVLYNIEPNYLENLLEQLTSLSLLSSLVITSVDSVKNKSTIYRRIFRLPALKYCKLSLKRWNQDQPLPVSTNEYSSIEYLTITSDIYLDEVDNLLSYVPQLRHLSFHSLHESWKKRTQTCSVLLNHLTYVFFKLNSIKFDQFEQLIIDYFLIVRVFRLTVQGYNTDPEYVNANRWKQLILSHITNLRIFEFEFNFSASSNDDQLRIDTQLNQFASPFWIERQCFVAHHSYRSRYGHRSVFYSTKPYRKKHYTLYKQIGEHVDLHHYESNPDPVKHVYIDSETSIITCRNYFPNTTNLTFNEGFSTSHSSITTILGRIIPLKQLTKLAIECHHFSLKKITELLYFSPNLRTLVFKSMPLYNNDDASIQQSETFRLVSTTNNITNVTFSDRCTLEKVKLLLALCPRLERLIINTRVRDLESITRFLLDKTNPNTSQLFSLCFSRACNNWYEKLNMLIKFETLLDDYTLKLVGSILYLWW